MLRLNKQIAWFETLVSESTILHLEDQVAAGLASETARRRVTHTPRRQIDGPQSHSGYLENHLLRGGITSAEGVLDKRRHYAA
jgi:hypothetical protein